MYDGIIICVWGLPTSAYSVSLLNARLEVLWHCSGLVTLACAVPMLLGRVAAAWLDVDVNSLTIICFVFYPSNNNSILPSHAKVVIRILLLWLFFSDLDFFSRWTFSDFVVKVNNFIWSVLKVVIRCAYFNNRKHIVLYRNSLAFITE